MSKYTLLISNLLLTLFINSQNQEESSLIQSNLDKAYAFYFDNKDSLRHYLYKAKIYALKNKDIDNLYEIYNVDSWNAAFYSDTHRIKKNIITLDSLTDIHRNKFDSLKNRTYRTIQFYYTKGQYYNDIGMINESNIYFNNIISIFQTLNKTEISEEIFHLVKESYIYIAFAYMQQNKLSLAEDYYLKNLRLIKQESTNLSFINSTLIHLARLYKKQGLYHKSNTYIFKSLPYFKNLNIKGNNRLISAYELILNNHIDLKKLDSASFYLNQMKNELGENHAMQSHYFRAAAKLHVAKKDFSQAITALSTNINSLQDKWNHEPNPEIAEAHLLKAKFYRNQNNYPEALQNLNLAVNQFKYNSGLSSSNQILVFKALKEKTIVFKALKNYNAMLKTSRVAISLLDSLKPSFKTNSDKLFLIENAFPIFENGIEAAYNLYQQTDDAQYLKKVFFYFEKSKSTLLLESLLSSQATKFADIPIHIIEEEKQLKAKIIYLEKQLNQEITTQLQDELFDTQQEHRTIISTIEKNYPAYYDLKYNTQVTNVINIQESLRNDEAVLSYFYGKSNLYAININAESISLKKIPLTNDFETKLLSYRDMLKNPEINLSELQDLSHFMYNTIIPENLEHKNGHVTIVPDGLLHYIPFETLVTSTKKPRYLLEKNALSYALSATLLEQLKSKIKSNANSALAFAPNFKGDVTVGLTRSDLLPLAHTSKEVNQILNYFKGDVYTDKTASLENFKSKSSDYSIIHLATHAVLNDEHPDYSFLAFSETDPDSEHLLYASDIYNSTTNADMVVLSACETGIGELKRGEGAISLARSFFYSGASSITSTLWKINDAASAEIMDGYYRQLSKGKTKDVALQTAKLDYIKSNKDTNLSHPYYWSAFVVSGNTEPLTSANYWIWIVCSGLLMVIAIVFLVKRKS